MFENTRLLRLALAVLSGLLLIASGEPIGLGVIAWVAFIPVMVAIFSEASRRWRAAYGFATGVIYFGAYLSWIFLFGWMAFIGLIIVMSAWWAGAAVLAGVRRDSSAAPIIAAAAFSTAELLRDRVPWGGFGWGTPGLSQAGVPIVRWSAGTVGASGLTFLLVFVGAVAARRIVGRRWDVRAVVAVGAVFAVLLATDGVLYGSPPAGRGLRLALVQGNVPRPELPDFAEQRKRVYLNHLELTKKLQGSYDAIIWGEDSIGTLSPDDAFEKTAEIARARRTTMIIGRTEIADDESGFYNLIDQISPEGQLVKSYAKMHPVPFGEYVPVGFLRGVVGTLDQVPYDLLRGDRRVLFDLKGAMVATPICFETVFARDVRAFASMGAELYIHTTNDSSFERTWAPSQHLEHARMRSLELRQYGVQVALSGHSAVLGPDGSVTKRTSLFEQAVVDARVKARPAWSLYARTGDVFAWGWAAVALLMIVAQKAWRRRQSPAIGHQDAEVGDA